MILDANFSTQPMEERLTRIAFFHAAEATAINKVSPGYTPEASFHWEAAQEAIRARNLMAAILKENADLQAKLMESRKENRKLMLDKALYVKKLIEIFKALNITMETA